MTSAELIKALRNCADYSDCGTCKLNGKFNCADMMMRDAADALEAAEQRIARLEEDLKTREAEREVMQDTIKICEEANDRYKARLPKEGEWIYEQRGKWIYAKCNLCGKVQDVRSNYCPNCGAKMKGENDEQIH